MTSLDDDLLVAAMARGERAALATLYDRHAATLLRLGVRIARDRAAAEDLLHDVFLEAWRRAKDFDPNRGRASTWLAVRMRSRALDFMKSARVTRNVGEGPLLYVSDPTGLASPDHGRVHAALASLRADQRRAIELAYFDGLSCSEIAELVGCALGTAKSRIAAGLTRLRSELADG